MQNSCLETLRRVTLSLLDLSRPAYSLRSEVLELRSIFENSGGSIADGAQDIAAGETVTARGVAISSTMASMCLDDFARTVEFVRGLNAAVSDLRKEISDRPIRVLYAGCGPWATLAVPLMSIFPASELTFTLLDIHDTSIASARSLTAGLGLSDRIEKFVIGDAADHKIESNLVPDIILIEMMRAALEGEPQVAVTMHLFEQAPNAVVIPAEVRVDLALIASQARIHVGEVFVLNKSTLESWRQTEDKFSPICLTVPEFELDRYRPRLLTTVRTYGEHSLKDKDSGITLPRILSMTPEAEPGRTIEFRYELGNRPGIRARYL